MESGLFIWPAALQELIPEDIRRIRSREELQAENWDVLALTKAGCEEMGEGAVNCRILLVPGECSPCKLWGIRAETVISYGLSSRDSLTLSSLRQPTLCVQRSLPRPDGGRIEPQEIPLQTGTVPVREILPLLGIKLLQMPLNKRGLFW